MANIANAILPRHLAPPPPPFFGMQMWQLPSLL